MKGIAKVLELKPTDPEKAFVVPDGLDLADIDASVLKICLDTGHSHYAGFDPVAFMTRHMARIGKDNGAYSILPLHLSVWLVTWSS